jgi:hypothetical protein
VSVGDIFDLGDRRVLTLALERRVCDRPRHRVVFPQPHSLGPEKQGDAIQADFSIQPAHTSGEIEPRRAHDGRRASSDEFGLVYKQINGERPPACDRHGNG